MEGRKLERVEGNMGVSEKERGESAGERGREGEGKVGMDVIEEGKGDGGSEREIKRG